MLTDVVFRRRPAARDEVSIHLIHGAAIDVAPPPRDYTEAAQSIGENLLDALCIKYGSQPPGLIMYDDRLKANIIGEFSVEFIWVHQSSDPVVRRQYFEVQDIDQISYRSLTHNTRIGDRYIPIVARIIPGTALPLLMGRDFRDDHAVQLSKNRLMSSIIPEYISSSEKKLLNPDDPGMHQVRSQGW